MVAARTAADCVLVARLTAMAGSARPRQATRAKAVDQAFSVSVLEKNMACDTAERT